MQAFAETRRAFLSSVGLASAASLIPTRLWASAWGAKASRDRGLASANDFMFDDGLVYLQTGSLGPTPRPVMQKTIEAWQLLERNPVVHGYGDLETELDVVREKAARLLGCTADEIVLTTSTTDGMCRVALGLNLTPGDRVLTTDQEHPGGRDCWDFLVRTRGVILDVVKIVPGEHDAAAIIDRMTKAITPRTKVMSFSHVLSSTGLRMPVAELTTVARAHGCVSVVDGAQAVGGIVVDVRALGCDVYVTSGHKWLLAPKGTGLLYVSASLGSRLELITLQDGHAAYSGVTGVSNIPGVIGLGAAIDYARARGLAEIETHNLSLRSRLEAALADVPKLRIVSPREPTLASPLLTYRLPDEVPARDLMDRLLKTHRVVVKVVPVNWFNGQRISTHVFNTEGDVDALVRALRLELTVG
jgi:selenocysteine lyase/cysteine desulfurase